jgi:hypothetical protein
MVRRSTTGNRSLGHPHQRIFVQHARQRPFGIKGRMQLQSVRYGSCLGAPCALADAKLSTDIDQHHVRFGRLIRQEIDLSKSVDDAAGPRAYLSRGDRAWSFSAQCRRHKLGQVAVLVVEVPVAKLVSQRNDLIVPRPHVLRDRLRPCDLAHEAQSGFSVDVHVLYPSHPTDGKLARNLTEPGQCLQICVQIAGASSLPPTTRERCL